MTTPDKLAGDDERPTSFVGDDAEAAAWAGAMSAQSEPDDDPDEDDTAE